MISLNQRSQDLLLLNVCIFWRKHACDFSLSSVVSPQILKVLQAAATNTECLNDMNASNLLVGAVMLFRALPLGESSFFVLQSTFFCVGMSTRTISIWFIFIDFVVVVVCGTHFWRDIAGSLTGVSWQYDNSRVASPTMMGRFGAPSWVKPTSVPNQQLMYPLDGALRYLSSSACGTQGVGRFCKLDRMKIPYYLRRASKSSEMHEAWKFFSRISLNNLSYNRCWAMFT